MTGRAALAGFICASMALSPVSSPLAAEITERGAALPSVPLSVAAALTEFNANIPPASDPLGQVRYIRDLSATNPAARLAAGLLVGDSAAEAELRGASAGPAAPQVQSLRVSMKALGDHLQKDPVAARAFDGDARLDSVFSSPASLREGDRLVHAVSAARDGSLLINGKPARELEAPREENGVVVRTLVHPQAPNQLVKVYRDQAGMGGYERKRDELARREPLSAAGAGPRLLEHGETSVDGHGRVYFLAHEIIEGLKLGALPAALRPAAVQELFERLAKAGRALIVPRQDQEWLLSHVVLSRGEGESARAYLLDGKTVPAAAEGLEKHYESLRALLEPAHGAADSGEKLLTAELAPGRIYVVAAGGNLEKLLKEQGLSEREAFSSQAPPFAQLRFDDPGGLAAAAHDLLSSPDVARVIVRADMKKAVEDYDPKAAARAKIVPDDALAGPEEIVVHTGLDAAAVKALLKGRGLRAKGLRRGKGGEPRFQAKFADAAQAAAAAEFLAGKRAISQVGVRRVAEPESAPLTAERAVAAAESLPPAPSRTILEATDYDPAEAEKAFDEKTVGIAATFRNIPTGKFMMGSPHDEKGRRDTEVPRHEVVIPADFELQTTPMTWGQVLRLLDLSKTKITIPDFVKVEDNADGGKYERIQGVRIATEHPAVNVSWADEQVIIDRLNSIQSEYTYRRPTEAEWEYAARAGSDESRPFKIGLLRRAATALKENVWFSQNSDGRTHAVGRKPANAFGLLDMLGNVNEWVQDRYKKNYKDSPADGSAIEDKYDWEGDHRVIRGGSWFDEPPSLRSAFRTNGRQDSRDPHTGIRLARTKRPHVPDAHEKMMERVQVSELMERRILVTAADGKREAVQALLKARGAKDLGSAQFEFYGRPDTLVEAARDLLTSGDVDRIEVGVSAAARILGGMPSDRERKKALEAMDEDVVGMAATFRPIPEGTFDMGSPEDQKGRRSNEGPLHEVAIPGDFELQTTPMTWGQLLRLVDLSKTKITIPDFAVDPQYSDGGKRETLQGVSVNSDHPAVNVSWDDEEGIIDRLNAVQSEYTYSRPTEAEWEYAARAGFSWWPNPFATMTRLTSKMKTVAWFYKNSGRRTHAVGLKDANAYGLRDMFGNVNEWVQDRYKENYKGAPVDGSALETKYGWERDERVFRGSSWVGEMFSLRFAFRAGEESSKRHSYVGIRLARRRRRALALDSTGAARATAGRRLSEKLETFGDSDPKEPGHFHVHSWHAKDDLPEPKPLSPWRSLGPWNDVYGYEVRIGSEWTPQKIIHLLRHPAVTLLRVPAELRAAVESELSKPAPAAAATASAPIGIEKLSTITKLEYRKLPRSIARQPHLHPMVLIPNDMSRAQALIERYKLQFEIIPLLDPKTKFLALDAGKDAVDLTLRLMADPEVAGVHVESKTQDAVRSRYWVPAFDPEKVGPAASFFPIAPGAEMQATQVTQRQYELMMNVNPSVFKTKSVLNHVKSGKGSMVVNGEHMNALNPVESASWYDAQQYVARLNLMQSEYTYRLPTDAELKSAELLASGDDRAHFALNLSDGAHRTHPVELPAVNISGRFIVPGNVREWVEDVYGGPLGHAFAAHPWEGGFRVVGGKSWADGAKTPDPARPMLARYDERSDKIGFRVVREPRR